MGLETDRNPSVNNLLNLVKEMVKNDDYENSKFEEKYAKIKDILGEDDRDLFLVDMDLQIKKGRKMLKVNKISEPDFLKNSRGKVN